MIPADVESAMFFTLSRSGLMTTKWPSHQTKSNLLWSAGEKEHTLLHCIFLILIIIFPRKPILLQKHSITTVINELRNAVVIRCSNNPDQARINGTTHHAEHMKKEIMTIKELKGNGKSQMERHMEKKIDDEKPETQQLKKMKYKLETHY